MKKRCLWCTQDKVYINYHDKEWGVLNLNEKYLYEMLILEGQQAGLSWLTILKKRKFYKKYFNNFNYKKISKYDEKKFNELLKNKNLIKNKLKITSIIQNAKIFLEIQKEFKSFKNYLFLFTKKKIYTHKKKLTKNLMTEKISKDLKKRGMKFVGATIIYSYLEAIGIFQNHEKECFKYKNI